MRLDLSDRIQFREGRSFRWLEESKRSFWVRKDINRSLKTVTISCDAGVRTLVVKGTLQCRGSEEGKGSSPLRYVAHLCVSATECAA